MPPQDLLNSSFLVPDYQGNSLLNLMSSIIKSRGGTSPHAELIALPAQRLRSCDQLIYLVIDGLGSAQLSEYRQIAATDSFLAKHESNTITSLFPATTASAITTFMTGASPLEHGILGWYLNLPDLGTTSTILLGETRTGTPLSTAEFDFRAYLALPSHLDSIDQSLSTISYKGLASSQFSLATSNWVSKSRADNLEQLEAELVKLTKKEQPSLVYAYWPCYDGICHQYGTQSDEALRYLGKIDAMLTSFEHRINRANTTLLVTADHGLIDVQADGHIDLMATAGVPECLTTLACGDNGHAACFVRPAKVKAFTAAIESELGHACMIISGDELLEMGLFGPGDPHPKLAGRLGDFYLIAKHGYCFIYPPVGHHPFKPKAYHGGLTPREMQIPLIELTVD